MRYKFEGFHKINLLKNLLNCWKLLLNCTILPQNVAYGSFITIAKETTR